jgi:TP901-1 family phage major tail protein
MPTFVHGKNAQFVLESTNLSNTLNEISLPREIETAETTTFGTQDKTYIVGLSDATVSLSGMFDATADSAINAVISNLKSGSIASASFTYGPSGSAGGKPQFTGQALVTSYEVSSPVGDVVTYSLELQVTGGVTGSTY